MKFLTETDVVSLIRAECDKSSQKEFADKIGFTPAFISDVLSRRRDVSAWLADRLGYERKTVFVKKDIS